MDRYDIPFMERALALARKGAGLASPNPMVGSVIVREAELVGEGFHQYEWRDHAEIVALKAAGPRARGATLYVSLEPCCHTGRTGPCAEAIVAAGVRRVVAAMQDPNPAVAGCGFERLRTAGVEVDHGIQEDEARRLNEAFACWIRAKRPFVTLKAALTLDGQLALPQSGKRKSSTWITCEESRAEVHRMRQASDALLTGIGTILADNPLLTDRSGLPRRRRLLRVILDSKLRLPVRSRIVETAEEDLLVFTLASANSSRAKQLKRAGVEVFPLRSERGRIPLKSALEELGRREILSVLLEAGSELNGASLAAGFVDKIFLFYSPKLAGTTAVPFARTSTRAKKPTLPPLNEARLLRFGPDFAIEGYLHDVYRNH